MPKTLGAHASQLLTAPPRQWAAGCLHTPVAHTQPCCCAAACRQYCPQPHSSAYVNCALRDLAAAPRRATRAHRARCCPGLGRGTRCARQLRRCCHPYRSAILTSSVELGGLLGRIGGGHLLLGVGGELAAVLLLDGPQAAAGLGGAQPTCSADWAGEALPPMLFRLESCATYKVCRTPLLSSRCRLHLSCTLLPVRPVERSTLLLWHPDSGFASRAPPSDTSAWPPPGEPSTPQCRLPTRFCRLMGCKLPAGRPHAAA